MSQENRKLTHLWEQMEGEPDGNFAAFHLWLMNSSRPSSFRGVADFIKGVKERPFELRNAPTYKTIGRWMEAYNWKDRAAAWDNYLRQEERGGKVEGRKIAARDEELQAYRTRLLNTARVMNALGVAWAGKVQKWIAKIPDGQELPSAMAANARGAATLMQQSCDKEAEVLGLADIMDVLSRSNSSRDDGDEDEDGED